MRQGRLTCDGTGVRTRSAGFMTAPPRNRNRLGLGNNWVIAAIVVTLPFCSRPVALGTVTVTLEHQAWPVVTPYPASHSIARLSAAGHGRVTLSGKIFGRAAAFLKLAAAKVIARGGQRGCRAVWQAQTSGRCQKRRSGRRSDRGAYGELHSPQRGCERIEPAQVLAQRDSVPVPGRRLGHKQRRAAPRRPPPAPAITPLGVSKFPDRQRQQDLSCKRTHHRLDQMPRRWVTSPVPATRATRHLPAGASTCLGHARAPVSPSLQGSGLAAGRSRRSHPLSA